MLRTALLFVRRAVRLAYAELSEPVAVCSLKQALLGQKFVTTADPTEAKPGDHTHLDFGTNVATVGNHGVDTGSFFKRCGQSPRFSAEGNAYSFVVPRRARKKLVLDGSRIKTRISATKAMSSTTATNPEPPIWLVTR